MTFDQGFSVLTGETGAGKSIFLDALDALLGGFQVNSGSRLMRAGTKFSQIEGIFSINPLIQSWLNDNAFDTDESELVVSREWNQKSDRLISRSRLNGVIVNRSQLLSLRSLLIDLTVQGQTQQLALPGQQLLWLDEFGEEVLSTIIKDVEVSWKDWQKVNAEYQIAQDNFEKLEKNKIESLEFLQDLENAQLEDPLEDLKLINKQDQLANIVTLQETLNKLFIYLEQGTDQSASISDQIGFVVNELKSIINYDKDLNYQYDNAYQIQISIHEIIQQLHQYTNTLQSDPIELENLQERLEFLKRMQRRYSLDLPGLISARNNLFKELNSDLTDQNLQKLRLELERVTLLRDKNNKSLTNARKLVANNLEEKLIQSLIPLGLENIRFKVLFNEITPASKGVDSVQFLFSANPDQELAPLAEIASGGEMSRFLLALKIILSNSQTGSTLLFDEIDSGVSGRISESIATALKQLSFNQQVFCVTHQPVIAAAADNHFTVKKLIDDQGITRTSVHKLEDLKSRQNEIATLAGGVFENSCLYAASLLEQHAA